MTVSRSKEQPNKAWYWLCAAWLVALTATLSALFIGEVLGQAPCNLCWYQRIMMFPLAIILALACARNDTKIAYYSLPLALIGWGIALYHTLSYADIISKTIVPCGAVSCGGSSMTLLGLIPLPYLALASFSALSLCLYLSIEKRSNV